MAIIDNNMKTKLDAALKANEENKQQTAQTRQTEERPTTFAEPKMQNNQQNGSAYWGFFGDSSIAGYDIVAGNLVKLSNSMNDLIKERIKRPGSYSEVIPLDVNNYPEHLVSDALLITTKIVANGKEYIGGYAVLVTNSNDTLDKVEDSLANGRRVELEIKATQFFSDEVRCAAFFNRIIAETNPGATPVYAGGSCLFTDIVDIQDQQNNLSVLVNGLAAGLDAVQDEIVRETGKNTDINLAYLTNNETLTMTRSLVSGEVIDAHGQPLRADFAFTLGSRVNNNKQGVQTTKMLVGGKKEVAKVTGYYDFLPYENTQGTGSLAYASGSDPWSRVGNKRRGVQGGNPNLPQDMTSFAVNVVFSGVMTNQYNNIGTRLLALVAAIDANQNNAWWVNYAIDPKNHPQNWKHSFAGLGYELSRRYGLPFEALPVHSEEYTQADYDEFVTDFIFPQVVFSMQYDTGSANAWRLDEFHRAAHETNEEVYEKGSATNLIIAACDRLTNGHFTKHFLSKEVTSQPGFVPRVVMNNMPNRRMVTGVYMDNGVRTSLAEIDRTYLLNQVNGKPENMNLVHDMTIAMVDPTLSPAQSAGLASSVIDTVVSHAVKTGTSIRHDLTGHFVTSLHAASLDAGLLMEYQDTQLAVGNPSAYNALYLNQGLVSQFTGTAAAAVQVNNKYSSWLR